MYVIRGQIVFRVSCTRRSTMLMSSFSNGGTLVNFGFKAYNFGEQVHCIFLCEIHGCETRVEHRLIPKPFFLILHLVNLATPAQFRDRTHAFSRAFFFSSFLFLPSGLGQPGTREVSRCGDARGCSAARSLPIGESGSLVALDPWISGERSAGSRVQDEVPSNVVNNIRDASWQRGV